MQQLRNVAAFGAAGGLLGWLFGLWIGDAPRIHTWVDPCISVALGAGAGAVFVFLIANTDRADRARLFTLALLAGFFWQPVWEGGRGLINHHIQEARVQEATTATERAVSLAESLSQANEEERDALLDQLNEEIERAATLTAQIDSMSGRSAVASVANQLAAHLAELPADQDDLRVAALRLAGQTEPQSLQIGLDAFAQMSDPRIAAYTTWMAARVGPGTAASVAPKISPSDLPPPDQLHGLEIGSTAEITPSQEDKAKWFRIVVADRNPVLIEANAEGGDLLAALYEQGTLNLIAWDDDGGGNRNPQLRVTLAAGEYLLRIWAYDDGGLPSPFSISAREEPSEPPSVGQTVNGD
jgi:hypothetical protein